MTSHDDELTDNSIGTKGHPCPTCGWPFVKADNSGEKCFCGLWEIDPECPVHGPKYRAEFPVAPPAKKEDSPHRHRFAPDSYYEPVAPPAGTFGEQLIQSAKEAKAIARGEMEPGAIHYPSSAMGDVEKLIERLEQGIDSVFDPDKGIPEAEAVMDKSAAILRALAAEKYNYLEYENALAKKRDEIASLRAKLAGPPPLEQEVKHLDGQIKTLLRENEALRAKLEGLRKAAQALLDDVHRRYPGEALRCPYMIALEAEAADART